jgi:ubiquinone/menaquinone biosynthesis C-methylase UbiE
VTTETTRTYLPGMGRDWMLPLYDPFTRLLGVGPVHRKLTEQAELATARRVLEIGCGTGNLALLVKRTAPSLDVVGLDPDPRALDRARRKARRASLSLELDRGFADQLPYPDASFDRVLSSLMFHHLDAELRVTSLREVARVLAPGGALHLVDMGGGDHGHAHGPRAHFARRRQVPDDDRLVAMMGAAGLDDPAAVGRLEVRFGTLIYYRSVRAG